MKPGKSPYINFKAWMADTHLRIKPRSSAIKRVDLAIQNYEEGIKKFYTSVSTFELSRMSKGNFDTLLYKEKWYLTEIIIALGDWKKIKGNNWKSSSRNAKGAITKLDETLNRALPHSSQSLIAPPDESFAANARTGILYFLSRSTTFGMPLDPVKLLSDAAFVGADVQHLVTIGKASTADKIASGLTSGSTSSSSFANEVNNIGFLNEVYNAVVGWLKEKMKGDLVSGIASEIAQLMGKIPQMIGMIFSGVLSELSNVVGIGRNLVSAISAYSTYRNRDELEEGVVSGHPKIIIESVYEQIKESIKNSGSEILLSGLKIGVNIASAGAGVILNALASFIMFISNIYQRIKSTAMLREVLAQARIKDAKWSDADEFQKWFLGAIKKLPIISCYCLTMPMTGSYYGFLAATATNNSSFSFNQLERNNHIFNDVKKRAFSYIGDSDLKISSTDSMVALSLKIAQGKVLSIDQTDNISGARKQIKRLLGNLSSGLATAAIENSGKNSRYGWW